MAKSTVAYQSGKNSFQKFLQWTNEKEVLASELKKYIRPTYRSFLSIGAGNGRIEQQLIDQFETVTLVEPAKMLHHELIQKMPQVQIINKKVEDITPFKESFDFIMCSHVFIYIHDPDSIISSLYSNLSDHGTMIIIMLDHTSDYLQYVDTFYPEVVSERSSESSCQWQDIVTYCQSSSIPCSTQDVTTQITAPSLDDFISINDFHFNTDVSGLSQKIVARMKKYLQAYSTAIGLEMQVKHKLIVVKKHLA